MQTKITKLIYYFLTYLYFTLRLALATVLKNKLEICSNASLSSQEFSFLLNIPVLQINIFLLTWHQHKEYICTVIRLNRRFMFWWQPYDIIGLLLLKNHQGYQIKQTLMVGVKILEIRESDWNNLAITRTQWERKRETPVVTEYFKVQCMFKLNLSFLGKRSSQKLPSWSPFLAGDYSLPWEKSSRCFCLLPACFCRTTTQRRLGVWSLKKKKKKGLLCGCCSSLDVSQKSEQKGGEARGHKSCNNHSGSETVGKFVIYTMPRVFLVCFNSIVWNIQWFWIKRNTLLLRQVKGRVLLYWTLHQEPELKKKKGMDVRQFVLNLKENKWWECVSALVSVDEAGAERASQAALEPSSSSAEELQVKRRLRLRLWTTEGSAAAPGRWSRPSPGYRQDLSGRQTRDETDGR